jgi:hypothetical protein
VLHLVGTGRAEPLAWERLLLPNTQGIHTKSAPLRAADFYTFATTDGQFDGRAEQLLAVVEGEAAELFKLLVTSFRRPAR